MFQGPKGYIAQICEVHLEYGNKMAVLHFFLVNCPLIYIQFSLSGIDRGNCWESEYTQKKLFHTHKYTVFAEIHLI